MLKPALRQFSAPAYVATISLMLFPLFDQVMQLVPTAKLHDPRWRFGALGLLSNIFVLPVFALMVILFLTSFYEDRVFQRVVSLLAVVTSIVLLVLTGLFALDSIQVRGMMRPQAMSSWAVATSTAIVKLLAAVVTTGWFGFRGIRDSGRLPAATESRVKAPQVLVGGTAPPKRVVGNRADS